MKKMIACLLVMLSAVLLAGCENPADVASRNLSKSADNFEIPRRVVFYNGINGDYILTIEGYCSRGNNDSAGEVEREGQAWLADSHQCTPEQFALSPHVQG